MYKLIMQNDCGESQYRDMKPAKALAYIIMLYIEDLDCAEDHAEDNARVLLALADDGGEPCLEELENDLTLYIEKIA